MKAMAEVTAWATLFALIFAGLLLALWWSLDPEARRESMMEFYGEDYARTGDAR